ncbi:hypothetical protein, partial [Anaerobaca lacustris]|nr:hypothetical protein [Sedimentisphaerales bacterium M17dextr]
PYYRSNGIDWKKAAWERLGTAEWMEEFRRLIVQAEELAATETEKQRVALWRSAIWEWMRQGRDHQQK